jgi:hypothetical protein
MFDDLIQTIQTIFAIGIILIVDYVIWAIAKAVGQSQKAAQRANEEQEEYRKLINQVALDSKKFPTELLISQRNEMQQAYNTLLDCKQRGAMQTKELLLFFRVGDDLGCSVDLKTSSTILEILNEEIQKRQQ